MAQAWSADDYRFMAMALQLAAAGRYSAAPNPHVGCVLVNGGEVVGRGVHKEAGTAHAEVHAIAEAGGASVGSTAYVTLEPCAHQGRTGPCADALIAAGVVRVVAALQDPNPQVAGSGLERCGAAGVEVSCGLLANEATEEYRGFLSRMATKRPWVTTKLAASVDGRTALANGESQWITGPQARGDVQLLRAVAGAMLTGVETILADDASLNVRLDSDLAVGEWRQPLRVILDTALRTPLTAKTLSLAGDVLIFCGPNAGRKKRQALQEAGAEVVAVELVGSDKERERLDLLAVLSELARREVNTVMVEAGARLNGSLLEQGLVDELVLYQAPHALGSESRGLFEFPLSAMSERPEFEYFDVRQLGVDLRLTLRLKIARNLFSES